MTLLTSHERATGSLLLVKALIRALRNGDVEDEPGAEIWIAELLHEINTGRRRDGEVL